MTSGLAIAAAACRDSPTGSTGGAPARLAITVQPSGAPAGATITPAVTVAVVDSAGNTVTSWAAPVRLRLSEGSGAAGAHLRGVTEVAAVAGVATFRTLSVDSAATGFTLTATTSGLSAATSAGFDVTPGPVVRLDFGPDEIVAAVGAPINPAVRVRVLDSLGNVVRTSTATVSLAIGANQSAAVLGGTGSARAANGEAAFADLTLAPAASGYTLIATSPGLAADTSPPFPVTLPLRLIVTGASHSCGLTATGTPYCWGYNAEGELGDGTWTSRVAPARVLTGLVFTTLAAGDYHTCGLTAAGATYCWGANWGRQLGDGTASNRNTPSAVAGVLRFTSISAGAAHTCGLTAGGAAWCWGNNDYGALGNGSTTSAQSPVAVAGGLTFQALSAGSSFTCGISPGGTAYCWGINQVGNLGDGSKTNSSMPVAVAGGLSFADISAGVHLACGLLAGDGGAYCWGWNSNGQLGDLALGGSTTPVGIPGGHSFSAIAAGRYFTCALTAAGSAFCWGDNSSGALGTGVYGTGLAPAAVSGGHRFTALRTGQSTCGVTAGGAGYCWGDNQYGEVGDGTSNTSRPVPVRVVLF